MNNVSSQSRSNSIFVLAVLATIPLIFGAVQPLVWSLYAAAMTGGFLVAWWRGRVDFGSLKSPWAAATVGVFLAWTLLQVLPLPPAVLAAASPERFSVLSQAGDLLGTGVGAEPLGYLWRSSLAWWVFLFSVVLFSRLVYGQVQRSSALTAVAVVMAALALVQSLYGLVQALIPTLGVLWTAGESGLGDARGTFINRNHFAGFVEMTWPVGLGLILALSRLWGEERDGQGGYRRRMKNFLASDQVGIQLFLWAALVFTLLGLLFSKSRAGITGAFIGFVSFLILSHLGGRRFSWPAWAGMGAGFGFLLFYGNVIGFEDIIGKFLMIEGSAGSRADIWKDTWQIIKDHPLGIGLANYAQVMPVYNAHGPLGIKYTHAHNDYLQLLAEAGWPGFAALAGGFFAFLGLSISRIVKHGPTLDPVRFFIGVGAVSGLITIAFHSVFDFNLQIPANVVYFAALIAIAAAALGGSSERQND